MSRFAGGRERRRVIPLGVAVLHLLLATWVPHADAARHASDFETEECGVPTGESPGAVISSVCFICSAGLGAFSPSLPDAFPTAMVAFSHAAPDVPETLVSVPVTLTNLARAPPLA